MLKQKVIDNNTRDSRLLEALLSSAVKIFGFKTERLGRLLRQVYDDCEKSTIRVGIMPLVLEVITHEIAHMLSEELPNLDKNVDWDYLSYKRNPANRRSFSGDLGEVHALAIQSLILKNLQPTKCWTNYRRVLETSLSEESLVKREHAVDVITRDNHTRLVAKSFATYIINKALSAPADYPMIHALTDYSV